MSDIPKTIDRRGALKRLGVAGVLGLAGAPGTAGAHRECGNHWANGAVLDCFINFAPQHDQIFGTMSSWENSTVSFTRPEWDGNVMLRVGDVKRVGNDRVLEKYAHYVDRGRGASELGEDRQVMLAGNCSLGVRNLFDYENHCGLINEKRCATSDVSVKYWYHELGHAHWLNHRTESGALMAPGEWYGIGLTAGETARWRSAFEHGNGCPPSSAKGGTATGKHVGGTDRGLVAENSGASPDGDVPELTIDPPTVIDVRPL